jgi:hypothetical protein
MLRTLRAQEELMVLVAGTRARRAQTAGRARALCQQMPWDALLADLAHQGLVPLLGGRILELAGPRAPAEFARAVRDQTDASRKTGALLELATLRIATALEAAGVPNVPLKGPLLARALHGDPGMRQSRDIDVLAARSDLARAAGVLEPLGWRRVRGAADPALHLVLAHGAGLPEVELHWRVHWYEAEFGARALARARPGREGVRRLEAVDELATLLLYHARDGLAGLRHPIDAAAWWDAHSGAPDSPLLAPIVRAHPGLAQALGASAAVLEELVGVPAAEVLPATLSRTRPMRYAIRLANPLMEGKPQQITAEISLVDGLLTPTGQRRAFLRRRVLPGSRELPARMARRPLPVARAEHALRLLRRSSLAVMWPRARPRLPFGRDSNR